MERLGHHNHRRYQEMLTNRRATAFSREVLRLADQQRQKREAEEEFRYLLSLAEAWGIEVHQPTHLADGFRGTMALLFSGEAIILNGRDSSSEQAFTLAHELGHWLLRHERRPLHVAASNPIAEEEAAADSFATDLLHRVRLEKVNIDPSTLCQQLDTEFEVDVVAS